VPGHWEGDLLEGARYVHRDARRTSIALRAVGAITEQGYKHRHSRHRAADPTAATWAHEVADVGSGGANEPPIARLPWPPM
jgi:hypothetical protein